MPIDERYFSGSVSDLETSLTAGNATVLQRSVVPRSTPVTIILPVFNAFEIVSEALERVTLNTDLDWHLVLIDDASTDARVRPFLRRWSAERGENRVTLVELDDNHGFVGAVNRGFDEAQHLPGPVILLNSDAMVPEGWASRLVVPFFEDRRIASVTPMSNDAEIFSVPVTLTFQLREGVCRVGGHERLSKCPIRYSPVRCATPSPT